MTEIVTLHRETVRPCFAWILPVWFAAASSLGVVWPGHSGQLFFMGALAGIWACLLVDSSGEPSAWILPTLVGGVPILFFLGRLLDRLRSDVRLWSLLLLLVAAIAGFVLLQGFRDLEHAVQYHGSFLAYCVCALQIGSYGATLGMLVVGASRSARR